uniref:Uncharacterized protein n=1 Tax=Polysiphonia scopulorum TaxID=257860 RepID=A0A1Z1MIK0_9FLOR|nr:hypothetical protein [Polysiphonia scopulorum]ARW65571.1 hypothetical protein [Polysiphonia scopulorum]
MTTFLMNDKTSWLNLPWRDIYIRVLMIKKRIFISSKKNDLKYLHKLQNYLINSNEAKVVLINKTIRKLRLYYSSYKQIKIDISQLDKLNLLNLIFIKTLHNDKTLNTIITYIKQSLVYCSVKPAFEARQSKQLYQLKDNKQSKDNFIDKVFFNNLLIQNTITKLNSCNYINNTLSLWLYENNCFSLLDRYNSRYKAYFFRHKAVISNNNLLSSSSLFYLICEMITHDMYWYIFMHYKKDNLYLYDKSKNFLYKEIDDKFNTNLHNYYVLPIKSIKWILFSLDNFIQIKQTLFHNIFRVLSYKLCNMDKQISLIHIEKHNSQYNTSAYNLFKHKGFMKLSSIRKKSFVKRINRLKNQQNYVYNLHERYLK